MGSLNGFLWGVKTLILGNFWAFWRFLDMNMPHSKVFDQITWYLRHLNFCNIATTLSYSQVILVLYFIRFMSTSCYFNLVWLLFFSIIFFIYITIYCQNTNHCFISMTSNLFTDMCTLDSDNYQSLNWVAHVCMVNTLPHI